MKTIKFLGVLSLCFVAIHTKAQNIERLKINYDDNGNRILRQYVNAPPDTAKHQISDVATPLREATSLVTAFPNDASSNMTLMNNGGTTIPAVLFDMNGKELAQYQLIPGKTNIDLSSYHPGYYLLTYSSDNTRKSLRLLKK